MRYLEKGLMIAGIMVGGILVSQDVMAMTDGALKTAWADSKLEALISGDVKKISALVGVAAAGVLAVIPKTSKVELIGGTFMGIVGTGLLMDWVKGAYGILI